MATINTDEFYTTDEAAKKIGRITLESLRRYCLNFWEGKTPAIENTRMGRVYLIPKKEVDRFKKERQRPGRPRHDK